MRKMVDFWKVTGTAAGIFGLFTPAWRYALAALAIIGVGWLLDKKGL
jgi:hypothetical protein